MLIFSSGFDSLSVSVSINPKWKFHLTVWLSRRLFYYQDVLKINEGKPPLYQDSTNKAIENSLYLLNGLDEDAAEAKRLQHPQAEMIEHEWVDATETRQSERDARA